MFSILKLSRLCRSPPTDGLNGWIRQRSIRRHRTLLFPEEEPDLLVRDEPRVRPAAAHHLPRQRGKHHRRVSCSDDNLPGDLPNYY